MPGKIMNPDSKVVGELAAAGCSNSEIADILEHFHSRYGVCVGVNGVGRKEERQGGFAKPRRGAMTQRTTLSVPTRRVALSDAEAIAGVELL